MDTHELIGASEDQVEAAATTLVRHSSELTVDQLVGQIEKVQDAMRRAMKDGEHYGVIPGTNKPTLLKPGAEKLCLLFRLSPTYQVTRREKEEEGHVEYEICCTLSHIKSGKVIASGVGLCSTLENKYRWRKGAHACPHCAESAIIKGKEEFGGGWLCWKKKGGCGAKFPDGAFDLADLKSVENPDLADTYNTVLKMAKKRAMVDATLTATAASDIFTQDMEDMSHQSATTPLPSNAPFVGTTMEPEGGGSDDQHRDDAVAYWETAKNMKADRKYAMQVLQSAGGDFSAAMIQLKKGSS